MLHDSVFDVVLSPLSKFSSATAKYAEKYQRDPTLLPERDILEDQQAIEEKYIAALLAIAVRNGEYVASEVDRVFGAKTDAADREDRLNAIEWSMSSSIANALTGLWVETWNLASTHATRELDILDGKIDGRFSRTGRVAEFREFTDRERYFLAYPPDYGFPLSPSELRQAVDARTMKLANDIDRDTARRIRETVRFFVESRSNPDGTMSVQARKDLVGQLGLAVGSGSRRKPLDGNYRLRTLEEIRAGVQAPNIPIERRSGTTRSGENPADGLRKRLRTIARTELSAAYNTARLNVYKKSGRVKYVRWNAVSDERLCQYCEARVGTIHPIDNLLDAGALLPNARTARPKAYDPREYVLPIHPNDRCHWEPVLEDDSDREDEDRTPESRQSALPSRIGMAVGGAVKSRLRSAAGAAATSAVRRVALNAVAVAQARAQQREQQRQQRKVFLATAGAVATAGTAVLGLSLLYRAISSAPDRATQPEAAVEPRPVPLWAAAPSALRETLGDLVQQTLDVRTVTRGMLKERGLKKDQVAAVMDGIDRVLRDEVTPLSNKIAPQLLSSQLLRRFPQLVDVPDLRNVTVDDLVRLYGAGSRPEATRLLDFIRRDLQNRIPEIPDVKVRDTPLTADTTWQEIYAMLPVALKNKRGEKAAKAIVQYVRDSYTSGNPIRSLEELRKVKGVGKKTIERLKSYDYADNPNTLALGFLADDRAGEILAGQLGLGPKLSKEIIQEAREGGQYTDVESLISRMELRRRRADGLMSQLNFGDREKKALREQLGGRVFPQPNTTIGQARSAIQQQRVSLGNTSAYENQLPPSTVPISPEDRRIRELAAAANAAQASRSTSSPVQPVSQSPSTTTSSTIAPSYVPPLRRRPPPALPGERQIAALAREVEAARSAIDFYKGRQVYRQQKLFGKRETFGEALDRIDRDLEIERERINSQVQRLSDYTARLNAETKQLLQRASEVEAMLKSGDDREVEALLQSLEAPNIEPAPPTSTTESAANTRAALTESQDLLTRSRGIDAATALPPGLIRSLEATGDTGLAEEANKLAEGLGLREEELAEKVNIIERLMARLRSTDSSAALQALASARERAIAARDKIAEVKTRAQQQLAQHRALQPEGIPSGSRRLDSLMADVRVARSRRARLDIEGLAWFRSAARSPDVDAEVDLAARLKFLSDNIDRAKRSERDADVALMKIRRYRGDTTDVDYVRQEMMDQSSESRSLVVEMERYRNYLSLVRRLADGVPVVAQKADAFRRAFDAEVAAIDDGLKRAPQERRLPSGTPRSVSAIKSLMEADRKSRDLVAFWESRGFSNVEASAAALDVAMAQWESDRVAAYRALGKQPDPTSEGVEAIERVRALLLASRSTLVSDYQPKIEEGLRRARVQLEAVQQRLQLLGGSAPVDSERYGLARRELLQLEQKEDLNPEEQRRAALLDREVRDRGMALYDRLLPESKQQAIARYKESMEREMQRLEVREEELRSGSFRGDRAHRLALEEDIAYLRRSISQWRMLIEQARGVSSQQEESLFRAYTRRNTAQFKKSRR